MSLSPHVKLYGYQFSVYSWIVRLVLVEKGVAYEWIEVDPFASDVSPDYLALNPFRRVPALRLGDFSLYETSAITRFIGDHFDGPLFRSASTFEGACVDQIISIVDQYGYWPMVRQVFSHGCFMPLSGEAADENEIRDGLKKSEVVLGAIEALAGDDGFLVGNALSRADLHLAPMVSYFTEVPAGAAMLAEHARLSRWWDRIQSRPHFVATKPDLDLLG